MIKNKTNAKHGGHSAKTIQNINKNVSLTWKQKQTISTKTDVSRDYYRHISLFLFHGYHSLLVVDLTGGRLVRTDSFELHHFLGLHLPRLDLILIKRHRALWPGPALPPFSADHKAHHDRHQHQ